MEEGEKRSKMETIKREFSDISMELPERMKHITELYVSIDHITKDLLRKVYGNEEIKFPIDIERVAQYLHIKVEKEGLNENGERRFSRILGRILMQKTNITIIADNTVGDKTQRYAIAHAIGRYLLSNEEDMFESTYAIPLIPQSLDEIVTDVIALFLLLPTEVFKKEFADYLGKTEDYPMNVDAWLGYLSDKSMISLFNLSIGYQQLKQVLGYERQKAFEKSG